MSKPELPSGKQACEIEAVEPRANPVEIAAAEVARPKNVVEFRNVTKTYAHGTAKAFTAIKDVDFVVEDLPGIGEFVGILGPSGCGKSTILRLIAGLAPQFPQTVGEVLVHGQPVTEPGPDRGMVFQDYTSFDNRSVLDNVAFGLECQGVSREARYAEATDWIGRVGLDPKLDLHKFPHELSGGMKQRVAIARTLILKPRIILMDEPFGALDPVTRHSMQDLLIELWRDLEATVFFITHDVGEAVYLADRTYILSNSPGTILHQMKVMPPDRPSKVMMREKAFQDSVLEISHLLDQLEEGKD